MSILASVVPGIRDIRAPLIAGYIWLFAAWLAVHPSLSTAQSEGAWGSAIELAEIVGPVVTAGAVSVVAYLIGSISQAMSAALSDAGILRRRSSTELHVPDTSLLRKLEQEWGESDQPELGLRYLEQRRQVYRALDHAGAEVSRRALRVVLRHASQIRDRLPAEHLMDLHARSTAALTTVLQELDLPATLLVGDQPQTFGETDRLRGEAQLRLAVVPPLTALAGVLAVTASALWLLGLLAVGVLFVQGIRRQQKAREMVASAIAHRTSTPSAGRDEFAEYVRQVRERFADTPSIDEPLGSIVH